MPDELTTNETTSDEITRSGTDAASTEPHNLPTDYPLDEVLKALIVLKQFVGDDQDAAPTANAASYKQLREALVNAGINDASISEAVKQFPIQDIGIQDGTPFINVDHPATFSEIEGQIVAMTAFFDTILHGDLEQITKGRADAEQLLPLLKATRAKLIEYPVDNINSKIWNLLEKDTGGQIALKAERAGSKKEINILYAIDFDDLPGNITITKRLTAFDKRVYVAIAALYNAGNTVISLTQIYYAMGYKGRPGKKDLAKINESVTKMIGAKILVNNEQEAAAYNYERFVYDGPLLPLERITGMVNGTPSEALLHPFREPPVISFAKQRKQITTIHVELLQSPISKTDANLAIDDYLIQRITRAKNGKQPSRILYKTICENVRATTPKQRQRIPATVSRFLDHYKKCGLISKYTADHDGVTVHFAKTQGGK